jgi:predicted MFS family arabinose efflux permease
MTDAPATAGNISHTGSYKYYVLAVLMIVSFFNYMDRMVLAVLVEPIKRDLGLSDTQMGLLSGLAFAVFYATLGLPLARWADTKPRVPLLAACTALWSATTAACGFAGSFIQLFVARIGVGVGEAGCVPISHSLLGDYFPAERRAFAVSAFQAGGLVGLSAGLMITGFLADQIGWRNTFFAIGLPGVAVGALVLLSIREPLRAVAQAHAAAPVPAFLPAIKQLLRRRAFVHLLIGIAIGALAVYGLLQWTTAFFVRIHQLTLTEIGVWSTLASVGAIVGTLSGGTLAMFLIRRDRRWELWLPAMAYAGSCPFHVAVFLVNDPWLALAIMFPAGFIAASGGGVVLATVQSFAEPHLRATAVAMMTFLSAVIGLGLGPLFVGFLSDQLRPEFGAESLRIALVTITLALVWAAGHFVLASRTMREDIVN